MNYPPYEIINPSGIEKKDFEYIILWMLNNNEECNWSAFLEKPLEISLATLSKYMNIHKDPEKQLRIGTGCSEIDRLLPKSSEIMDWPGANWCDDIGRKWSKRMGFFKWNKNNPQGNITWIKEKK